MAPQADCEYCGQPFEWAEGDAPIHYACPGPHPFAGGDAPQEAESTPAQEQEQSAEQPGVQGIAANPELSDQERQQQ